MFVWLASYPKSGNTWLRAALWSLLHDGATVDLDALADIGGTAAGRNVFERTLSVQSADLTADEVEDLRPVALTLRAARMRKRQAHKVHDAWRRAPNGRPLFPAEATAGAIYVVRDPRAVVPSWAHHARVSADAAIAFLADPTAALAADPGTGTIVLPERLTTWSRHVESWLDGPSEPPVVIRYEDMLADPARELRRAAAVMGWSVTAGALAGAVAATRFDALRRTEADQGFRERSIGTAAFFRRGEAGGWRDELTPAQVRRIEDDHAPVMRRLGYL